MTTQAAKELYQHAGMKLRLAREQAELSIADMADKTKLTPKVLRELEAGEGDIFSTPIYVRGQLRSYARALGVDIVPDIQQLVTLDNPTPVLEVRETTTASSRAFATAGQYALYLLVTAVIAVPVVGSLNLFRTGGNDVRPLDGPAATAEAQQVVDQLPPSQIANEPMVATGPQQAAVEVPSTGTETNANAPALTGMEGIVATVTTASDPTAVRQPMAASMTGMPGNGIVFKFNQDSWAKFTAPDGSVIEQGLMKAGTVKQFNVGALGKARIGAAEQVQMSVNGTQADIAGFTKGSVANLTIGNDGMPVAGGAR